MFYGRIGSRGTTEFLGFVGSALAIRKSFLDSLERSRRIDSSSANDPRSLELFLHVALRAIAPLSFVTINAYPDKGGNRVWLCTIKNIPCLLPQIARLEEIPKKISNDTLAITRYLPCDKDQ
ncbi:hypothetical protein HZH68_012258 [Vespula germanica]|uniref:Uncharacterized protein n=1 Tax=Vespula germanica TaxID=30212 RepID=A0A834JIP7_VESGE|nr:hypothetical protein HZH68_012258 [Vespula germanica]